MESRAMISARAATILAALGACLPGCSATQIAQFETKVATKRCAKEAPTSPENEQCVARYYAQWEQEKAVNREGVAAALGIGIAARAARNAKDNEAVASSPEISTNPSNLGQQFMATRKEQDLYDLVGGPLVVTNLCYVYANTSRSVITGNKIVFLNEAKSCEIKQVFNR